MAKKGSASAPMPADPTEDLTTVNVAMTPPGRRMRAEERAARTATRLASLFELGDPAAPDELRRELLQAFLDAS